MWLVLLHSCVKRRRVYVQQRDKGFTWSGIVLWVTPWVLAMRVSYEDPDSVHTVYIPMRMVEEVRDFVPDGSRNDLRRAYRDDDGEGITTK